MEYAKELLESVKENFYVPEAVDDMAECCAIFAKEFGETDIKCAEPYFYYGKALLEMSRLEAEVLGHAMEGIDIYAEDSVHPQVKCLYRASCNYFVAGGELGCVAQHGEGFH